MAERAANDPTDPKKQKFLSKLTNVAMFAGLVTAYGTLAAIMARFLYPSRPSPRGWMFVTNLGRFASGESRLFTTPSGESVNITRRRDGESAQDFVALSSVCPHLGCQVHWEPQNDRYFCPCHNGVFSPDGVATAGPPADASQSLLEYPLKVEGNLLFIEVAHTEIAKGRDDWKSDVDRRAPGTTRVSTRRGTYELDRGMDPGSPSGLTGALRELTNEPVPNHLKQWWFALGGTPAYLFVIQIVTGILLAVYYESSTASAYESVRRITEESPTVGTCAASTSGERRS